MGTSCSSEKGALVVSGRNTNRIPAFKVVLIGDPGVGKTGIFTRYTRNQFDYNYIQNKKPNIENVVRKINLPDNSVVSIMLWDLPGTENIDLRTTYYRDVQAAVVVVDMKDDKSIELAGTWKQDFLNQATTTRITKETLGAMETTNVEMIPVEPNSIPVLLLGNKYDLVEQRIINEKLRNGDLQSNGIEAADKGKDGTDVQLDKEDSFDDSEEEIGINFTSHPQRKSKKDKPECVKLLEQTAVEHGFIGSVVVSAKDGDASVSSAIQSLIRHLVEKHCNLTKKKKVPTATLR